MSQTIDAVFDGLVFRPLEPVDLAPNTRVRITLAASALTLEGIAARLDEAGLPDKSAQEAENSGETSESEEDLERYIYEHYVYSRFSRRERD